MDLPARQGRFYKALIGFTIANLCLRVLFAIFFYWTNSNMLFLFSLISIAVWSAAIIFASRKHQSAAFAIGMIDTFFFVTATSIIIGWQGGFYLLLIDAIPLNFYNTENKPKNRIILGGSIILLLLLLFSLSNFNLLNNSTPAGIAYLCFAINLVSGSAILALIGYLFEASFLDETKEMVLENQRMVMMANTDPLTLLINRRIMMTKIEQEKERVDRGEKPFTLIMIDVDNFKQINDEFGHDGGDFVLSNLARMINFCLRKTDLVARWGGDEFLILLPETPAMNGQVVADKIKKRITHSPFVYRNTDILVTVTLGVAQCDHFSGIGGSIRKADQALYQGKHAGKNQVVLTE